jgi:hypothetical protein
MDPFGRGAGNKQIVLIPFLQISRVEVRAIRPCDPNGLSQLLPKIIQIELKILEANQSILEDSWSFSSRKQKKLP